MAVNVAELRATLGLDASAWNRQIASVKRENVAFSREVAEINRQIAGFQRQLRAGTNTGEAVRQINALRRRKAELRLELDANNSALRVMSRELPKVTREARRATAQTRTLGSSMRSLRGAVSAARGGLAGFGLAALARNVGRANREITRSSAALLEQAAIAGTTSDQLEVLQRVFRDNGVQANTTTRAIGFLTRSIGEAQQGVPARADAFAALGISLEELGTAGSDIPGFFLRISEALQGISSPTERAAILADIFQRSWQDLSYTLNQTPDVLREQIRLWQDVGVSTDAQNQRMKEIDTEYERLRTQLGQQTKETLLAHGEDILAIASAWNSAKGAALGYLAEGLGEVPTPSYIADFQQARDLLAERAEQLNLLGVSTERYNRLLGLNNDAQGRATRLILAAVSDADLQISRLRQTAEAERDLADARERTNRVLGARPLPTPAAPPTEDPNLRFARDRAEAEERWRDLLRGLTPGTREYAAALATVEIEIGLLSQLYPSFIGFAVSYTDAEAIAADAARRRAEDERAAADALRAKAEAQREAEQAARDQARAEREAQRELARSQVAVAGLTASLAELVGLDSGLSRTLGQLVLFVQQLRSGTGGDVGLLAALSGLFGGTRHAGGPVRAGLVYRVREGEGFFASGGPGRVADAAGAGTTIQNLYVQGVSDPATVLAELSPLVDQRVDRRFFELAQQGRTLLPAAAGGVV